jgi:hypothetical protein
MGRFRLHRSGVNVSGHDVIRKFEPPEQPPFEAQSLEGPWPRLCLGYSVHGEGVAGGDQNVRGTKGQCSDANRIALASVDAEPSETDHRIIDWLRTYGAAAGLRVAAATIAEAHAPRDLQIAGVGSR